MAESGSILGNSVVRLEDPALLTGAGKYVDDLTSIGAVRVVFVRSSVAHGRLRSVDVSHVMDMPGVLAVYHAGGDDLGLAPFQSFPMLAETFNRPVFAEGTVRFVGDIVAAVVAETDAQAVDAAEVVVIESDPLPVVMAQEAALSAEAPLLFPANGSNVCFGTAFGADDDPLDGAEVVAEVSMVSQRLAGVPMESNGCLMVPGEPPEGITCWISHQAPHSVQPALAAVLGLDPAIGPSRVSVGRWWLRSEGRGVCRVPRGRSRGHAVGTCRCDGRRPDQRTWWHSSMGGISR